MPLYALVVPTGRVDPANFGVPVRDAATVMLVRDGVPSADAPDGSPAGLEVFLLRRSLSSAFVGGVYVFPGGAVDEEDAHEDLGPVCEGRTDAEASRILEVERGGLAFWVAAVRECFEEAGVLLAHDAAGNVVSFADPDVAARFDRHRRAVDRGERRLVDVCREEGLRLSTHDMHYWSHWVTPLGLNRRYDTRFFVCAAPPEQVPLHDDRETIAHVWIRPADALAQFEDGSMALIKPTVKSLEAIARFPSAGALLTAASAPGEIPIVVR